MELNDQANNGIKIYRDNSPGVEVDRKAIQQGVAVQDQDINTGIYTLTQGGDEQGWLYTGPRTSSQRHDIGSWAQAVPAILNSDGKIVPIKDKSLAVDTDYAAKTQTTVAGDSAETVRVAETTGVGTPGIVVACLNDKSQEQIFFPISDKKITVDNKTSSNYSSKIYDINEAGQIDITNVGSTRDLLYNELNKTYIKTTAEFRESYTYRGPLNFEASGYPVITTPTTPAFYETKLVFDTGKGKWRMYTIGEASATATVYARVRWRYWYDGGELHDFSECELVNYDAGTDAFSPTGVLGWIASKYSKQCQFHTAGTNTIFSVRLIKKDVSRIGIVRDLFYCAQCVNDEGEPITHFNIFSPSFIMVENRLRVFLHSDEYVLKPWTNILESRIKTNIGGVEYANEVSITVPRQWRYVTGADYAWTEVHDISRGMDFWARPIRPVHAGDYINNMYESAEQFNGGTIAHYSLA